MPDLADLFPGYASHWIDTSAGKIFARAGGKGRRCCCCTAMPQTNVMWHRGGAGAGRAFQPRDRRPAGLRLVGRAGIRRGDHAPYDKRTMANAMVEVMEKLGHVRFRLAGHDRGGRVAYRLALDHPGRLEKLATLDIVPTSYDVAQHRRAVRVPHLALDLPGAARAVPRGDDRPRSGRLLESHERARHQGEIADVRSARACALPRFFQDPLRIHATCEDYRAGRTTDLKNDEADRAAGKKITCPMLALWGAVGIPSALKTDPLSIWREWANDVRGFAIDSGHYLPEENPAATRRR